MAKKIVKWQGWKPINTTRFDVIFFCFGTLTSYLNKKERWLTYSFSMSIFFSIFGIKRTKKMAKKIVKWQRWKPINKSALPGGNTWKILAFQNQSLTLVLILSKLQFDHNFVKCHKFGTNFHSKFHWWTIFLFLESLLTFQDRDLKVVCLQGQKRVEKKHSAPITGL